MQADVLADLMRCITIAIHYRAYGYKKKQTSDAIYSHDLVRCFHDVFEGPQVSVSATAAAGTPIARYRGRRPMCGLGDVMASPDHGRIGNRARRTGTNARFERHYTDSSLDYVVALALKETCECDVERRFSL